MIRSARYHRERKGKIFSKSVPREQLNSEQEKSENQTESERGRCSWSMTSPKITADKSASNASVSKQDSAEGSNGNAPGTSTISVPVVESIREAVPNGFFSWLKVFRFANLMIKQGC
ncbi:uncharacterized protein LOC129776719 [Toxorhynchites rutilus septentrionalis]|uniref:uncharacterized protein LOC129776719 n=1 Tax=Toxorhynchites rutilus septentrionalis TaxID=329112 RepID=UPI0024799093|nr:uncharacterized protein LOC129776719 [Toxorhynchites rutilus septentrionalis]